MRLAVEQRDPDVFHRIASDHPGLHLRPHALFYGRDELPWHDTTDDLVNELEARAGRRRFDLDVGYPVLAMTAGLLHVAAHALGLARDGLAQRHPQSEEHTSELQSRRDLVC